jgi:hypothetical protein
LGPLRANLNALGAILEPLGAHLEGFGGGLGGLGAAFGGSGAVLARSWAVLEESWRPSCGNIIFRRVLNRFWGRLGRPRGGQMEPKIGPKTDQNRRRKRRCQKKWFKLVLGRSWSRLGPIFGPSWPNLKPSWGDLGAAGVAKSLFFLACFNTF